MDYLELKKSHPELFKNDRDPLSIRIIHSAQDIEEWRARRIAQLKRKKEPLSWADIGVILDDPYYFIVRDLVRFPDGRINGYNRILGRADLKGGQAVAVLPLFEGEVVVVKQYRHPIRAWAYEIPRGYGEPDTPAPDQAATEIQEEIKGKVGRLHDLGVVYENSGAAGFPVALFLADLEKIGRPSKKESIKKIVRLPLAEFEEWIISGKISDGFTLAAYTRAKLMSLI